MTFYSQKTPCIDFEENWRSVHDMTRRNKNYQANGQNTSPSFRNYFSIYYMSFLATTLILLFKFNKYQNMIVLGIFLITSISLINIKSA